MKRPRKTVATHEAGHAVAAVCLDIGFKYVTIIPGGAASDVLESDTQGHIKLKPAPRASPINIRSR
jgi:ATP-dependent Zn protease